MPTEQKRARSVYQILAQHPIEGTLVVCGVVEAYTPEQARRRATNASWWGSDADAQYGASDMAVAWLQEHGCVSLYAVPLRSWQGVKVTLERTERMVIS